MNERKKEMKNLITNCNRTTHLIYRITVECSGISHLVSGKKPVIIISTQQYNFRS